MTDDTEALLSATAEPERDHTARATPLPDADETWLYRRAAMLDVTIRRDGRPATQTVRHLHIHIVPRAEGDGLPLPWTPQQEGANA